MRSGVALLLVCALMAACGPSRSASTGSHPSDAPGDAAVPGAGSSAGPAWDPSGPDPDTPIPRGSVRLASRLEEITDAARSSIGTWTAQGDLSAWPPPRPLVLQTLYQQRIYRMLAAHPRRAKAVMRLLGSSVEREARATVAAGRKLLSLGGPASHPHRIRTRHPEPIGALLRYYRKAQRRFHVAWEILAAVNYVESKFGRVVSSSSAGAQGPMQFLPATWDAYGLGGNVHDAHDAILGAANYLHASGAPRRYRRALFAYNHSFAYVDAVLLLARNMMRDRSSAFAYYNWQVFVRTENGDLQLTGPGS